MLAHTMQVIADALRETRACTLAAIAATRTGSTTLLDPTRPNHECIATGRSTLKRGEPKRITGRNRRSLDWVMTARETVNDNVARCRSGRLTAQRDTMGTTGQPQFGDAVSWQAPIDHDRDDDRLTLQRAFRRTLNTQTQ